MVVDYDRVIAGQFSEKPHHRRESAGAWHRGRYRPNVVTVESGLPTGSNQPTPEQRGVDVHPPKLLVMRKSNPLRSPKAPVGLMDDSYWQPEPKGVSWEN